MRYLTDSQAKTLQDLGFRVLKTKADYHPSCCSDWREHILFEARANGLHCWTMCGKYGKNNFVLPETAIGTDILVELCKVRDARRDSDLQHALRNDSELSRRLAKQLSQAQLGATSQ